MPCLKICGMHGCSMGGGGKEGWGGGGIGRTSKFKAMLNKPRKFFSKGTKSRMQYIYIICLHEKKCAQDEKRVCWRPAGRRVRSKQGGGRFSGLRPPSLPNVLTQPLSARVPTTAQGGTRRLPYGDAGFWTGRVPCVVLEECRGPRESTRAISFFTLSACPPHTMNTTPTIPRLTQPTTTTTTHRENSCVHCRRRASAAGAGSPLAFHLLCASSSSASESSSSSPAPQQQQRQKRRFSRRQTCPIWWHRLRNG